MIDNQTFAEKMCSGKYDAAWVRDYLPMFGKKSTIWLNGLNCNYWLMRDGSVTLLYGNTYIAYRNMKDFGIGKQA
jgi:hypothetical protein